MKLQEKLHGKNINFLIGSGASYPVFETLNLGENKPTFEELVSNGDISELNKKALYYFYYKNWILPMKINNMSEFDSEVLKNYKEFIKKIINILSTQGVERPKRANIFTTNYDLLFEDIFESIIDERENCYFNDGSSGFIKKVLNPNWYNLIISLSGYNDNYKREVPTINLFKMHGSVSWSKNNKDQISIDYNNKYSIEDISELDEIDFKSELIFELGDDADFTSFNSKLSEIAEPQKEKLNTFYDNYKKLAIINPNKWKFHDTVFEQHYYQMIRNFSYELEKENSILVVFAFSFADEHILEIFKRLLNNPSLEVIIICYSEKTKRDLQNKIGESKNITYYPTEHDFKKSYSGNFAYFNMLLNGEIDE